MEAERSPVDSFNLFIEFVEGPFCFKSLDVGFRYFGDMFREVSFVDGLHISPVILDGDLFELSLVLVVPRPEAPPLLFGESAGAGNCGFATVSHLDVH